MKFAKATFSLFSYLPHPKIPDFFVLHFVSPLAVNMRIHLVFIALKDMDHKIIRKSLGAVEQKEMHSSTPGLPDVMRFFSTISSIIEIPSHKVDKMQEPGPGIPAPSTPRTYSKAFTTRARPGIPEPSTGEEGDQQATDKVEQWLGLKNNIPLGTPTPTNEKNAIPNGSKTKDQLQKRRPGKINVSKSTLPHEATDAFERDVARSGAGMVVRDAAGKKVFFQDHSHSHPVSNSKSSRCTSALIHSQGHTFRAGCDWVDCNSPLLSAPSLDSPVRPASSLAASNRQRSKCKYEEAVAAAVRTAQLAAAATRRTSKVGDIKEVPCGAWGSVEEGTFVTL